MRKIFLGPMLLVLFFGAASASAADADALGQPKPGKKCSVASPGLEGGGDTGFALLLAGALAVASIRRRSGPASDT